MLRVGSLADHVSTVIRYPQNETSASYSLIAAEPTRAQHCLRSFAPGHASFLLRPQAEFEMFERTNMEDRSVGMPSSSRRQVLAAPAWTALVLATAVATLLASASPYTSQYPGSVRFVAQDGLPANYVRTTGTDAAIRGTADVALIGAPEKVTPFTVSVVSTAITNGYRLLDPNFSLSTPTIPNPNTGPGEPVEVPGPSRFTIQQATPAGGVPPVSGDIGQTLTVTFPRPVRGLTFEIQGFTRSTARYSDALSITGAPFTFGDPDDQVSGSQVSGSGTKAEPWTVENVNIGATGSQVTAENTVRAIRFAGPLTSFSLHFYSSSGNGATQAVFPSNMNFTASCA